MPRLAAPPGRLHPLLIPSSAKRHPLTTRPVRRGRSLANMPAQPMPAAVPRTYADHSKVVLQAEDLSRVIDRIAHQILEKTHGAHEVVLLGIPTRGEPLASRLAA